LIKDYGAGYIIKDCNVEYMTLTGRVTPTKANIEVVTKVFARPSDPQLTWKFTGNAISGPKLVTTGNAPTTDGKIGEAENGNGNSKTSDAPMSITDGRSYVLLAGSIALLSFMALV
jgi:hypothetical protein